MSKKFHPRQTHTVFLILGHGCNMACKYCLQIPLVDRKKAPLKINPDIYEYLEELRQENENGQLHIHFFGGEPLLYFDTVKEIVETFQKISEEKNISILHDYQDKSEGYRFSLMTNGYAATEEIVNWCNDNLANVAISWDGHISSETRGHDVFRENPNVINFNNIMLNAILTSKVNIEQLLLDFKEIRELRRGKNQKLLNKESDVTYSYEMILDTGDHIELEKLADYDYEKIYSYIYKNIREYINKKTSHHDLINQSYEKDWFFGSLYDDFIKYMNDKSIYAKPPFKFSKCCDGIQTVNLGIDGNLFSCHNNDNPIASIYDSMRNYIRAIMQNDYTYEISSKICKNCLGLFLCRGGCKTCGTRILTSNYFCKIRKTFGKAIADAIINATNEWRQ